VSIVDKRVSNVLIVRIAVVCICLGEGQIVLVILERMELFAGSIGSDIQFAELGWCPLDPGTGVGL
jgi:hypothetical protein